MAQFWYCDSCEQKIEKPEDGMVEWLTLPEVNSIERFSGLRVVHSWETSPKDTETRCQYDQKREYAKDQATVRDGNLADFLGSDGLMRLLSFVATEGHPKEDVLEVIKRLHIPGYEQARAYFNKAIAQKVFQTDMMPGYYRQVDIKAVLAFIEKESAVS